jgi:hypothetical protein
MKTVGVAAFVTVVFMESAVEGNQNQLKHLSCELTVVGRSRYLGNVFF